MFVVVGMVEGLSWVCFMGILLMILLIKFWI